MPTYEYRREDGTTFEVLQRFSDPVLEQCPDTGQKVTRVIGGGVGLIFKGSGFYLTDYVRNGENENGSTSKTPDESSSGKKKSESDKKAKPETTSASSDTSAGTTSD